jgi:phage gp46-like protein
VIDVLMTMTPDGGEVTFRNGQPAETDGPETAVLLSLFGGNDDDSGSDGDKPKQWWANHEEPDQAKHYRSETQALILGLPAVPANLKRIEDAVGRDLAWMVAGQVATFVGVVCRMPRLNWIDLEIELEANGERFPVKIGMPWGRR